MHIWRILLAISLLSASWQPASGQGVTLDLATLIGSINPACTRFRITGPCICGIDTPCLTVEYWEPLYAVTTVKVTGKPLLGGGVLELLAGNAGAFASLTQLFGLAGLGGGGAGNTAESGQTNLHFNEARVYRLPSLLGYSCQACQSNTSVAVHYISDIDPLWRTAQVAPVIPVPFFLNPLGVWAPLFPRIGFTIHGSEPVAAVASATRALHIANHPVTVVPTPDARWQSIVTPATHMSTCFQPGWPAMGACLPTGTHPALWENGMPSPTGEYLWFYWVKRTCCVRPEQAVCGAGLSTALGAAGFANFCPLPLNSLGILAGALVAGGVLLLPDNEDPEPPPVTPVPPDAPPPTGCAGAQAPTTPGNGQTYHITPAMSLADVSRLDLQPGDRVLFQRGGTWHRTGGQLRLRSGSSDNPIVYGAYGDGPRPVFLGAGHSGGPLAHIIGQWIIIENLEVQRASIQITHSHHITLRHSVVRDSPLECVHAWRTSQHILIEQNTISGCGTRQNGEGIYIGSSVRNSPNGRPDFTSNVTIRGNTIRTTRDEGIELKAGALNVLVEHNIVDRVSSTRHPGIRATHHAGRGIPQARHIIRGNTIRNAPGGGITDSTGAVITGNHYSGPGHVVRSSGNGGTVGNNGPGVNAQPSNGACDS